MHAGEFLVKTKSGRTYLAVVGKSKSAKSKSSKSSDYSNLNRNSTMGLGTGAMSQIRRKRNGGRTAGNRQDHGGSKVHLHGATSHLL